MSIEARKGINRGAWFVVMLAAIVMAFWGVYIASADSPPSDTETAVIECGDSASGHGGSADNPPACEATAMPQAAGEICETFERSATARHYIDGEAVGETNYSQHITLCYDLNNPSGTTEITYGDWTAIYGPSETPG